MHATTCDLFALTAADLMSREIVTIPEKMSLRGAARLLRKADISGAPVVDAEGRCTGVLSATDFVRRAEREAHPATGPCPCDGGLHTEWEVIDPEKMPADEVRTSMSRDPVTVAPDVSISELARMMLDAHIHRIIIVDADNRPIGVVSATDIFAAIARLGRVADG